MAINWQLPVGAVCVIMGFLLSTQIRNQLDYRHTLPTRRVEELAVLLKNAEQARDDLTREVADLRAKAKAGTPSALAAGYTAMRGTGLEVVIKDSPSKLQKGEDPNLAIVHNDDLLRLVNELRAGGAEVVGINDQRLVETSEITCAGSTILVNQRRMTPPYVVKAIGNPEGLAAALNLRGGILDYLQFYGIQVSISKRTEVQIPMYSGGSPYRFAKPVAHQDVAS